MPTHTGNFNELLAPGLRKIFFQVLKAKPEQYSQIFNKVTTKRAYEEDLELFGLGSMPEKPEGSGIAYQDPGQGGKKRYTMVSFGLGFRVTREMWDDDLYGQMKKMPKELAKAALNVREVRSFSWLHNAFSTEYGFTKNGSSEAFFNTAHTLLGGGTQANRAATDADFGVASLEAAILLFDNMVDELGFPVTVVPKKLIHGPVIKQAVREVLGSEMRPYSNTNTINAVRMDSLDPVMVNYLVDTNTWVLTAANDEHDLKFFVRTDTEFQDGDDFDSGDAKYKAFQRFAVGAGEYRGTFGSLGT